MRRWASCMVVPWLVVMAAGPGRARPDQWDAPPPHPVELTGARSAMASRADPVFWIGRVDPGAVLVVVERGALHAAVRDALLPATARAMGALTPGRTG